MTQAAGEAPSGVRRTSGVVHRRSPLSVADTMEAAPLAALDLPLKVLVWADDAGAVWRSFLSAEWLAGRYGIPADVAKALSAVDVLTSHIAGSS